MAYDYDIVVGVVAKLSGSVDRQSIQSFQQIVESDVSTDVLKSGTWKQHIQERHVEQWLDERYANEPEKYAYAKQFLYLQNTFSEAMLKVIGRRNYSPKKFRQVQEEFMQVQEDFVQQQGDIIVQGKKKTKHKREIIGTTEHKYWKGNLNVLQINLENELRNRVIYSPPIYTPKGLWHMLFHRSLPHRHASIRKHKINQAVTAALRTTEMQVADQFTTEGTSIRKFSFESHCAAIRKALGKIKENGIPSGIPAEPLTYFGMRSMGEYGKWLIEMATWMDAHNSVRKNNNVDDVGSIVKKINALARSADYAQRQEALFQAFLSNLNVIKAEQQQYADERRKKLFNELGGAQQKIKIKKIKEIRPHSAKEHDGNKSERKKFKQDIQGVQKKLSGIPVAISQTVGRKAEQNDAFFTSGIGLCSQDAPRYLQEACNRVEKQFRYSNAGSMACMVHMDRHSQTITVANVGINRVFILIRDKQTGAVTANRLSVGHRPNDPVEMTRIYMHGGGVSNGKVSNFLATSRIFGGKEINTHEALFPQPDISQYDASHDRERYQIDVCICSKGAFRDCISEREYAMIAEQYYALPEDQQKERTLADYMTAYAYQRGSIHNITVLVFQNVGELRKPVVAGVFDGYGRGNIALRLGNAMADSLGVDREQMVNSKKCLKYMQNKHRLEKQKEIVERSSEEGSPTRAQEQRDVQKKHKGKEKVVEEAGIEVSEKLLEEEGSTGVQEQSGKPQRGAGVFEGLHDKILSDSRISLQQEYSSDRYLFGVRYRQEKNASRLAGRTVL